MCPVIDAAVTSCHTDELTSDKNSKEKVKRKNWAKLWWQEPDLELLAKKMSVIERQFLVERPVDQIERR